MTKNDEIHEILKVAQGKIVKIVTERNREMIEVEFTDGSSITYGTDEDGVKYYGYITAETNTEYKIRDPQKVLHEFTLGLRQGGLMEDPGWHIEHIKTVYATNISEAKDIWAEKTGHIDSNWDTKYKKYFGWEVVEM